MDIFVLTDEKGQLFPPVRQASIFAKYSRSPQGARELSEATDDTSAAKFQKKWIVDFGHNSIAELATLPVAFEGVSIIASKFIEKWQRPGVCEKSTRMQEFSKESLLIPEGLDPRFRDRALDLVDQCFDLYQTLLRDLPERLQKKDPNASDRAISKATFDIARHLLPAGCRTNLGICAYPRDIASMISEALGSPNPEFQKIGRQLQEATVEMGGPLVRHTEPDEWVHSFQPKETSVPYSWRTAESFNHVELVRTYPNETEFWGFLRSLYELSPRDLNEIMSKRPPHHGAPDPFRFVRLDYKVLIDYGAFRDLQRHRRMDQYVGPLVPSYGFVVPSDLLGDLRDRYRQIMFRFGLLEWPSSYRDQLMAQYVLPLAFQVRWHVQMDLQQLYYLVELRTVPQGHWSYRKVAHQMLEAAETVYPALTQWVRSSFP